jgi:hypothetical protein
MSTGTPMVKRLVVVARWVARISAAALLLL